jgi:hypothetical protein
MCEIDLYQINSPASSWLFLYILVKVLLMKFGIIYKAGVKLFRRGVLCKPIGTNAQLIRDESVHSIKYVYIT